MRILTVLLLLGIFSIAFTETVRVSDQPLAVTVTENQPQRVSLEMTLGQFETRTIRIDGQDWEILDLPGENHLTQKGEPSLPRVTRSLAIPETSRMELRITDVWYQDFSMNIAPSKGILPRTIDPSTVEYTFSEVYRQDRFFPGNPVTLGEPYILRDIRGQAVHFVPFAYNPVQGVLRVYTSISVEVVASVTDTRNVKTRSSNSLSPWFAQLYGNRFINWDPGRYTSVPEQGRMIVICYDSFLADAQPFVDWKNQKGIQTDLYSVSTIGATSSSIKSFIQSEYDMDDGLTFVQLIGDAAQIPTFTVSGGGSDPSYALLEGNDSYPDIFVGRFSAENASQVQTQVQRTIHYERDITTGTWLPGGMGIASSQGAGQGDDGEADYVHMNNIRNDLLGYTYTTVDQIYDPSASVSQVAAGLNAGRSVVNYCGHGSTTSWSSSGFSNTDINNLTNDNMLPFIFSVACVNGNFVSYTCFAEAWMRATHNGTPTGAIGIYASTINQSWAPPMAAQDEMTDLLVAETKHTFGGLAYNGSCLMMDEYGTDGQNMYKTWHIFGDPSLMVRTTQPVAMTVTHAPTILLGQNTFAVTIGVGEAQVSLWDGSNILGSGYADASGQVTLNLNPAPDTPGDLTLTVTAYNQQTYTANITVQSSAGPYLVVGQSQISAGADGVIGPGETVGLTLRIDNIGTQSAPSTVVSISESDPYISISDAAESYGTIAAGSQQTVANGFAFNTFNTLPDDHPIVLNVTMQSGTETWTGTVNLTGHAPVLELDSYTVLDNQNGVLDPGENAGLDVILFNDGGAAATGISAQLTTSDSWVSVTSGTDNVASIDAGSQAGCNFAVSVDPGTPAGHQVTFWLSWTADHGISGSDTISLPVGLIIEDFESGDFSAYNWEFFGSAGWHIAGSPYEGAWCAQSDDISDNQNAILSLTVDVTAAGNISFWKKVSSEASYDYLRFSIDGTQMGYWSGSQSWSQSTYPVSAGTRTFSWEFDKDYMVSSGSDCAWIDYIEFPPMVPPQPGIDVSPLSLDFGAVVVGGDASDTFTITNTGSAGLSGQITTPNGFAVSQVLRSSRNAQRNTLGYTVPAGENRTFEVVFTPDQVQTYSGQIVITHNASSPQINVQVSGSGAQPPVITVDPPSFALSLNEDTTTQGQLTLGNSGGANLDWNASIVYNPGTRDILLQTGFEGGVPPAGWTTQIVSGSGDWTQSSTQAHSGSYSAYASWSSMDDSRMISPVVSIPSDGVLEYWLYTSYSGYGGDFGIEISTNGSTWTMIDTFSQENIPEDQWSSHTLSLASWSGQDAYLSFRTYNNDNANGVYLDDITLTGTPGPVYNWLTFGGNETVSGTIENGQNSDVGLSFDSAELDLGTYTANIVIDSNDPADPQHLVPVTLNVTDQLVQGPLAVLNTQSLDFTLSAGQTSSDTFTISNLGEIGSWLSWEIEIQSDDRGTSTRSGRNDQMPAHVWERLHGNTSRIRTGWMDVNPLAGVCGQNESDVVTVQVDSDGLTAGTYTATLTVQNNGSTTPWVNVNLTVESQTPGDVPQSPRNIAEFEPMEAVLVRYPFGIPVSVIAEMAEDLQVITVVGSTTQQATVQSQYNAAGIDPAQTQYIIAASDSYWIRDYGPWFITNGAGGVQVADFTYNRPRPNDNAIPSAVAGYLGIDDFLMPIEHTGGNWMTDGYGVAVSTTLVQSENPSLSVADIEQIVQDYLGIETYHMVQDPNGDYIQHVDCFAKFLDVDKILLREVPQSHTQYDEIEAVVTYFQAQTSSWGTPYQIFRVYTPNDEPYSNSLIINDKVLVPVTGSGWDDDAIATYQAAMPGYEIIGVTAGSNPWESTDALHCRAKGVADRGMIELTHIPLHGTVDAANGYEITASIRSHSGSALIADSLKIRWRSGGGAWQNAVLTASGGNDFTGVIPAQPQGTQIEYILRAVDGAGKTRNHPFIGTADPHQFTAGQITTALSATTIQTPADDATDVSIFHDLHWGYDGVEPDGFMVYFGDETPLPLVATVTDPAIRSWNPGILDYDASYSWKVVPFSEAVTAVGCPVGTFDTEPGAQDTGSLLPGDDSVTLDPPAVGSLDGVFGINPDGTGFAATFTVSCGQVIPADLPNPGEAIAAWMIIETDNQATWPATIGASFSGLTLPGDVPEIVWFNGTEWTDEGISQIQVYNTSPLSVTFVFDPPMSRNPMEAPFAFSNGEGSVIGLDAPQNLTISIVNADAVLSWDPVIGADSYTIEASTDPYSGFTPLATDVNETTWTIPTSEQMRYYRVRAVRSQ